MQDNQSSGSNLPAVHKHSHLYLALAIVGAIAIAGGVIIAIKNFNTEQDIASTQIPAECTSHSGSALACSRVRSGLKNSTSKPASTIDTSQRKTYTDSKNGFSFNYPNTVQVSSLQNGATEISQGPDDLNPGGIAFYSFDTFNKAGFLLSDGAVEEPLQYDSVKKQWIVAQSQTDGFCPVPLSTSIQKVPFYEIGDFRSGREWDFAYVTSSGILVLSEQDSLIATKPVTGVDPHEIKFINPTSIISVGCSFK